MCMKEAFHDLVWHTEGCDGPVCLWVIGRLAHLQEGDNLGTASYFRSLNEWRQTVQIDWSYSIA